MKTKLIYHTPHCRRLILVFAGWSMDWRPLAQLRAEGYDIMVVWDYSCLEVNWTPLLRYDEICVLAWSMGVFAASVTVHELLPRITRLIAVNGTLDPVHNTRGIPPAVFHGTLQGLSASTLRKFHRRMCVSAEQFEGFQAARPQRTVADVTAELAALETHAMFHVPQVERWDLAIVSREDRIFPPDNQIEAWRGVAPVQLMQAGHLPDFERLLPRLFINKDRVRSRFEGAAESYAASAVAQHAIARRLYATLAAARGNAPMQGALIEVGVGCGTLTAQYAPHHTQGAVSLWDIARTALIPEVEALLDPERTARLCCDAEVQMRRTADGVASFIVSASTIQWFNSAPTFMRECSRVLAPGGWLAVSTFVQGNLPELSAVTGTGLQLPTAEAWLSMLPDTLEVVAVDQTEVRLTFDSPRQVLEHLRLTGVNAVSYGRSAQSLARRVLEMYPRDAHGKCSLTFKPLCIVARKVIAPKV